MLLQILVITGCFKVFSVLGHDVSVVRHIDGDIFTVEGYCINACSDVSSGTASPYNNHLSMTLNTNTTCICQCNSGLPLFREDLNLCVSDIQECRIAGFLSSTGVIEKVPYVFLPQRGQIVYPQAEIQFEGIKTPLCGIAGSQQLGKYGWTEFKNISSVEPPFKLFRDEGRTFLQWNGEPGLRDAAEGKIVVARLVCRDASPKSTNPGVFSPCVTFRVAGSPSKTNIREVTFASAVQPQYGLSTIEYTAIGIAAILLALIYIASVSLYLHSRKSRQKDMEDPPEIVITGGRNGAGLIKKNPLLTATRHFESDTNSGLSESDQGDEFNLSDNEQGFEKVTSAIVHPQQMYMEQTEGPFGTSIIAERLPEEDVRIVETIENTHQQDMPVLPGTQRRKLYFNPAYFERQLLIAPPPAAIEFLLKIREVISIAKHKMSAKRFIPTLSGIPEEESSSERCASTNKRAASVQGSVARSKKSQKCTGCPGCMEARPNLPVIVPDISRSITGDSRIRAWLEDVKPPERRYNNIEDNHKNFQENIRTFARSLENLRDNRNNYMNIEQVNSTGKTLASWKENPPMLRTFQNIARSEILGDNDNNSVSRRSTKSMFEDTNYDRFCRTRRRTLELSTIGPDNEINAKVRKAIENSFIKQMEETAALENQINEDHRNQTEQRFSPDGSSEKTNPESISSNKKISTSTQKRKKSKAPDIPGKELNDIINEIQTSKTPAKKIMDAVIKEMKDVKALDHHDRLINPSYKNDSLDNNKNQKRKIKKNIVPMQVNDKSDNTKIESKNNIDINNNNNNEDDNDDDEIAKENYYKSFPEFISQRPDGYSLVSEVYVNDGYASPANSDDSGPEIRYEAENPGHLTIKVHDSPNNYVKQDESEYEPDTLDRKPMRLKINGDVIYEKDMTNENYIDSLERPPAPTQILLKSKGSFRIDDEKKNNTSSLTSGYETLRDIYAAKLKSNTIDSKLMKSMSSLNDDNENVNKKIDLDNTIEKTKYLTPDQRQARRQRKQNQPDVVPLPPPIDNNYLQKKPTRQIDNFFISKNVKDRSTAEAGSPTVSDSPSVQIPRLVGTKKNHKFNKQSWKKTIDTDTIKNTKQINQKNGKIEDSGYLSSTDSSESHKQLLKYEFSSVSETDETESICDGASESGAESIGTDSVFFGNFRKLSNISNFSKSIDSGVDIGTLNSGSRSFNLERQTSFNTSDSENESFVTVLPYGGSRRNSLVL
ncbi:uncharacterized protein LOC122859051 [Aphidius gifuensis]|uniref:uncharacterized protein LOC122859051 n=1 Tax=Aphidius gifuensis TaxID=684658 RepID=UPI001CDBF716|nr:uncharacterized protein LOC122859051 [Aphidius gifuensis]